MKSKEERAVLVCTKLRAVVFGYTKDTSGDTIFLRSARNCFYWDAACEGFLGLANVGPVGKSKVGKRADIELREISCVVFVTPEAVKVWEEAKWSS